MGNDKFIAMVGFAKRAGKVVYGYDNLKTAKRVKLLAVSDSGSDNLKRGVKSLAERWSKPIVLVDGLENIVGNNCKAFGITDENMALAMMDYVKSGANGYRFF